MTIPAKHGKAVALREGQRIKVINDSGTQVVDTWAFNANDLKEVMSMEHTRAEKMQLVPKVGDSLLSNQRRAILTILEDTCGVHDTLISSCDKYRYQVLGCQGYHRSCTDNLYEGMAELGLVPTETPSPLNLWMNVPWDRNARGELQYVAPTSKPNDYVVFRADMDAVIAFSACPNDMLEVNGSIGPDGKFKAEISDCHYEIL